MPVVRTWRETGSASAAAGRHGDVLLDTSQTLCFSAPTAVILCSFGRWVQGRGQSGGGLGD